MNLTSTAIATGQGIHKGRTYRFFPQPNQCLISEAPAEGIPGPVGRPFAIAYESLYLYFPHFQKRTTKAVALNLNPRGIETASGQTDSLGFPPWPVGPCPTSVGPRERNSRINSLISQFIRGGTAAQQP